jgi:hypothetical protein
MRCLRTLCARRAEPQDDLLTAALVQAEEVGAWLSEDELLAMVFLLQALENVATCARLPATHWRAETSECGRTYSRARIATAPGCAPIRPC